MDRLIIKNFGPIKDISIDVNDINIFIGHTSSGKSTVSKLVAIFTSPDSDFLITNDSDENIRNFEKFSNLLIKYNIDFALKGGTEIKYFFKDLSFHINNQIFSCTVSGDEYEQYRPIYIPAERALLPNVGESLFGLMRNNISIPHILIEFGNHFEIARSNLKELNIALFHAKYEYSDRNNYLRLPDNTKVKLEATSSGIQSTIPMMLVINYYAGIKRPFNNFFIIEEPEMNLYPSMQKSLVEFIISKINQLNDKLIITTHSPYTLTTIDNLIQAKNTFNKHPELKDEINQLVPENLWVDFDKVSCYYFEDGCCRSTLDSEDQSIGPSNIDDVSEELGKTFDRLLELKYKN